jgi:hypothetical protein
MPTFYAIKIEKLNFAGELRFNDVPLQTWRDSSAATLVQPVNMWIAGKRGKVSFRFALSNNVMAKASASKLSAEILAGSRRDQSTTEAKLISKYDWPGTSGSISLPNEIGFDFESNDPPPSEFWPNALSLELTKETIADAISALKPIHEALSLRDLAKAESLLEFKVVDVGRSFYMSEPQARSSQRDFLEFITGSDGFAMDPLNPDALQFHVVADKRLVWVTRANFEPALSSKVGKGPRLLMPVYIAPVRNKWVIVR